MVFCGVAIGGWSMLRRESRLRKVWAAGSIALVAFGIAFSIARVNVAKLDSELRFRGDAHASLEEVLRAKPVRDAHALRRGVRPDP